MNFNRLISLLLLIAFYSPAWDLGTIWAPFTEKAPLTQAIKETPRTRKNVVFMRVSGVFQSLNRPEIILCKRELFYYFLKGALPLTITVRNYTPADGTYADICPYYKALD